MYIGIWAYPWDLSLDVVDRTLEEIVGLLEANVLAVYVNSLEFTKINLLFSYDNRVIYRRIKAGGLFFEPQEEFYRATRIQPYRVKEVLSFNLKHLSNRAYSFGLELVAHVNCLNISPTKELGMRHLMVDNIGYPTHYGGSWSCPLNPDVRRYVIGLVEDLATRDLVSEIELGEYWHPLSPILHGRITCFCKYCRSEAKIKGIDLRRVASKIRKRKREERTRMIYEEAFTFSSYSKIAKLPDFNKASEFWDFRMQIITDFVGDLADIIREYGVRVTGVIPPPDLSRALAVDYRALHKRLDMLKPALYYKMYGKGYLWYMLALRRAKRLARGKGVPAIIALKGMKKEEVRREAKEAIRVWKRGLALHSYGLADSSHLRVIGEIVKKAK